MKDLNIKEKMTVISIGAAIIIAILSIAITATGLLWDSCNTVLSTAFRLGDIRWCIDDYNGKSVKTEQMTARIVQLQNEEKTMQQSDDWRIRTYYFAPGIIKLIVILSCLVIYLLLIAAWLILFYQPIRLIRNYRRKCARRRKKLRN